MSDCPSIPDDNEKSKWSVFVTSTRVEATPEALFAFHADPHNITEVMPPLKLVKLVADGPAFEGRLIELRWLCRWKKVAPPHLLVDEIIEGPFRLFVHEHRFDSMAEGGSRMTDRVTYAWGRRWWGRVVSETAVRTLFDVALRVSPSPHPALGTAGWSSRLSEVKRR